MALGPGASWGGELGRVVGALPADGAAAVREWLSDGEGELDPARLMATHSAVGDDTPRPDPDDPQAIRRIGVIGGGTAGYLTALALQHKRPWLEVSLVESPGIPIIGVGESTVPFLLTFLHHFLEIDADELYRRVRPTWKTGINFEWGPHPDGFRCAFDWSAESVGLLGAMDATGNITGSTLGSALIARDRAAVFEVDGKPVSLLKYLPFAYHLDNKPFVEFLTDLAKRRGVKHVPATVADVVTSGPEWVDHLVTTDGQQLEFDLFVDCTGFRSLLLEKALGTPFVSFGSSLFTDRAVTGNVAHHGHIKPYTDVITMNAGWNWGIPTPDSDHRGYVYSSDFLSDDEAAAEMAKRYPGISEPKVVRFRSGRHEKAWRGNVVGIGNAYAFTEPLESSGLVMAADAIWSLLATLPASWSSAPGRDLFNSALNQRWDQVRWLITSHYKFNTRLDTPFWRAVRADADVSGFQPILDMFAECAPLSRRSGTLQAMLNRVSPTTFELYGMDNILFGMQVPTKRLVPAGEPLSRWRARRQAADALAAAAMPTADAIAAYADHPELNHGLLNDDDSWAGHRVARMMGMR
ncbi:tryptophan 7-halogenase [Amycolatopsis ultiminotia]|uniref:Tryptophan 7-halogenase n=2 Tax=Amycolatopsis ultiminotia TaxID=543629 RepID=A0ABP6YM11_9PSEU